MKLSLYSIKWCGDVMIDDIPMIRIPEDTRSNAQIVEEILERIYGFQGEVLNNQSLTGVQYELEYLTGYVTLIMADTIITSNYYGKPVEKLLYFFNKDVAYLLRLQLELQNTRSPSLLDNINAMKRDYKWYCYNNNRCLVYEFDPLTDEYFVDPEMSCPKQLPPVYSLRVRVDDIKDGIE